MICLIMFYASKMGLHIAHSVHIASDRHAGDMIFVPSSLLYFIKKRILVINTDIGYKYGYWLQKIFFHHLLLCLL